MHYIPKNLDSRRYPHPNCILGIGRANLFEASTLIREELKRFPFNMQSLTQICKRLSSKPVLVTLRVNGEARTGARPANDARSIASPCHIAFTDWTLPGGADGLAVCPCREEACLAPAATERTSRRCERPASFPYIGKILPSRPFEICRPPETAPLLANRTGRTRLNHQSCSSLPSPRSSSSPLSAPSPQRAPF